MTRRTSASCCGSGCSPTTTDSGRICRFCAPGVSGADLGPHHRYRALEVLWPLSVIAAPLLRADAIRCERQPAGIALVDSLARYRSACSRACRTKERPGPLVHEIRRAARHVAGGLLVAQNIVTAVRDCIAGRGWSGLGPVGQ